MSYSYISKKVKPERGFADQHLLNMLETLFYLCINPDPEIRIKMFGNFYQPHAFVDIFTKPRP